MDDDYSTDLLLASLLNDNVDDDCGTVHTNTQVSTNQSLKIPSCESTQQTISKPTSDGKTPHFDSLEDLLNATLSPSEESSSDLDKTSASSDNACSIVSTSPSEVISRTSTISTASVGLPPKFRNTFKPVEVSDTTPPPPPPEFHDAAFKSPSYVVASQTSISSINNNVLTDSKLTTSTENTWQQKNNTLNDSMYPSSKRLCLEGQTSYYTKSIPSVTAITTTSINPTSLSVNNAYSNILARTESNVVTQQQQQVVSRPLVTTSVSLNGVNCTTNCNTATNASNNAIDLKRLQETNLVSELQAASTKPISSASILHAIQVVQLNYSMLLQKLSQNIDDATAQEVKTKLMVLTHHYKQLAQQYQAKLSAEKTTQLSSNVATTAIRAVTNTTSSIGSSATVTSHSQSSMLMPSVTTTYASTVIDLTHDKSIKTTTTATNKESCVTVTAPAAATIQHLTNTTVPTAAVAGANVSSYLQSIPSLAAYLLQNTEAQKQLTPMELQQLNQIRVNLLQEFQRRQVQNFLTSLPADARPKNVNELKDMMKEKNFSIQVSITSINHVEL